jgi:hypothetical protein
MTGDTVSLDLSTIKWMVGAIMGSITALVGATVAVWRERKQLEELNDVVFGTDKKTGEGGLERIVLGNAARNEKGLKVKVEQLEEREGLRDAQATKHGQVLSGVIRGFDVFGSGEHEVAMRIREKLGAVPPAQSAARRDLVAEQDARFDEIQRSRTPTGAQRRLADPRAEPPESPTPTPPGPPPKRRI